MARKRSSGPRWIVRIGKREHGPINRDELRQWALEGRITPDSQVCQLEIGVWQAAGSVPLLFEVQPASHSDPAGLSRRETKETPVPDRSTSSGTNHSRPALVIGLVIIGLALIPFAFIDSPAKPATFQSKFELIEKAMPREEVQRILGAATAVDTRVDLLGGAEIDIDILEWRDADGTQWIRIEFIEGKVTHKELSDH